jgi:putative nucleotidyltransferase with HDIG domain
VCGATDRGVLLACSDQETLPDLTKTWVHAWNGAGSFETNEWLGAYWSGPLEAHYGVPGWTAVIVTRSSEALAPARTVMRTFGLALLATLCAVTLVVFQQLRRLLDPVGQLKEGTARLAQGQFDTRVAVATGDEFQDLGESFNTMAGELQRTFQQLHELSEGTLEALARAIDAKSAWTAGHSSRVTSVAVAIARALGYDAHAQERIRRGGLLHDIGKIGIAANILDKPDSLTKAEMAIMREHPTTGARILQPLPHCAEILPMVLQHHERLDGSGYPAGLRGSGIALDARILAVADVYDAMTSDRPYRKGLPATEASAYIVEHAGTRFDPAVVTAFLTAMSGPGQLMAAEDGALARTA